MVFDDAFLVGGFCSAKDVEISSLLAMDLSRGDLRYGLFCRLTGIVMFGRAVHWLNRIVLSLEGGNLVEYFVTIPGQLPSAAQQIGSVTFGPNCVLFAKAELGDRHFLERTYASTAMPARA